jgi:hypothetical protein
MKWFMPLICFFTLSCGVKGKPQPPLTPALLGRGEPSYSKATEKLKVIKKKSSQKIEGDFEETDDFAPTPEDEK